MPTTSTFTPEYGRGCCRSNRSGFHRVSRLQISNPQRMRRTSLRTRVSICGMFTGSCFWYTQAFMQSLQMRCPVPGAIGLSMQTSASAERKSPSRAAVCISEMRSSSGHPVSGVPRGFLR